ncbi:hypothetical protein CN373_11315 [Bacillus cereus]|uniref:hypothetical protein n=1 Tax=Bacillus TaxID=1386 RepID=UPI000BF42CF7|nr:hypothetical protein [Bacillus cereus]MCU7388603.1 hypothetical protein [Bacillus sp. ST24]PFA22025.1 hypothetical protein CN373_11315 [Bacillus cereus]
MFESEFEKKIREEYDIWNNYEPYKLQPSIHPFFPNHIEHEWKYPPRPTFQAVYFFGKLKEELSRHITDFEMALEVCLKTGVNTVVFIDIAVWYNGTKHAIEVHGDKKEDVVINKKTDSLLPYNWLIHHVFNGQIENENELKLLLHSLVKRIIINNANDAGNVS